MGSAMPAMQSTYVFDRLNLLCRTNGNILNALGSVDGDELNHGLAWLCKIDTLLRSPPDAESLVACVGGIRRLVKSPNWNDVLTAITADASDTTQYRREHDNLRSLWGVTPLISLITGVKANRTLGVESESLVFTTFPVTQEFDINLSPHLKLMQEVNPRARPAFEWLVLLWALYTYDIFFFFNDRGILEPKEFTGRFHMGIRRDELALLRISNKYIYCLPYGADYRKRKASMALRRFNFCMDCPKVGEFCFCNDEAWPIVFHSIAAYATAVIVAGLAIEHIPCGYRLDYIVVDTDAIRPSYSRTDLHRNVRILHVSNHPHFKGTRYLQQAVERLKEEGEPIEFEFAMGVSNKEVLLLMRDSDVVVDQLIGGNFGLTALEAMAHGKPVIVYLPDRALAVAPDECPLINADPDTIYDVLKKMIQRRDELPEIGRRSRRYVENHYSVPALVLRLYNLYWQTAGLLLRTPKDRPTGVCNAKVDTAPMDELDVNVQGLPVETLQRQLDAAYLALEALEKDRSRLQDELKRFDRYKAGTRFQRIVYLGAMAKRALSVLWRA